MARRDSFGISPVIGRTPMMPDHGANQVRRSGWLIRFTDEELDAIYSAIEGSASSEAALDRVIEKITPLRFDDSRPAGAELPSSDPPSEEKP
jgi:hypothetical protein